MNYRQIAQLIPREYRREIIDTQIISSAVAVTGDPSMHYLGVIWKNYVSPDEDMECGLCLMRILENFQKLQQTFVDLEKEARLLDKV